MNTQLSKNQTKLFLITYLISTFVTSLCGAILAYRFLLESKTGIEYSIVVYASLIATSITLWIAHYIDKSSNSHQFLVPIHVALGGILLSMAYTYSLTYMFLLMFFLTTLNNTVQSIIFKFLPTVLEHQQLISVNASLQEIHTFGFIFGPIVAPLLKIVFKDNTVIFLIDAFLCFLTAAAFNLFIRQIHCPVSVEIHSKNTFHFNVMKSYQSLFKDRVLVKYLIGFLLYITAFSPMTFGLSLIAKHASSNQPIYFSLPILSMFFGMFLSSRFIVPHIKIDKLLSALAKSLSFSGVIIFPLSMVDHLAFICALEFFLGVFISIISFSETTYSQIAFSTDNLGKLLIIKQFLTVVTKSIFIAVIVMLASHNQLNLVTPFLAFFFVFSGYYFYVKYNRSSEAQAL